LKDYKPINDMCLNCTRPSCNGICDDLRASMGAVRDEGKHKTMTWNGCTHTVSEWADILGVSRQYLYEKLNEKVDPKDIFRSAFIGRERMTYSSRYAEEVYNRLSTMHLDYSLFWATPMERNASLGMVTHYGKIQSAPTNKVTNIVESLAIPEAMLSDDVVERRSWIAMILFLIQYYNSFKGKAKRNGDMKAFILEQRALQGLTLKRIAEEYNKKMVYSFTLVIYRRLMNEIVDDIIQEGLRRGLLLEHLP